MAVTLTSPARTEPSTSAAHRATTILHAWHLLSLDAPTLAVVWTAFIARANHRAVPPSELLALFLAVWLLYVADRLLDTHQPSTPVPHVPTLRPGRHHSHQGLEPVTTLQPRHLFHQIHHRRYLATAAPVTLALIPLTLNLPARDLHLDLLLAAVLTLWFALIHRLVPKYKLPKELTTGLIFATAVVIPTFTRLPATPPLIAEACLFAAIGTLNGLYISFWEADPRREAHPAPFILQPQGRMNGSALTLIATSTAIAIAVRTPAPLAVALAAIALLLLDRTRSQLLPTTLRAAADFALLTPILLWPLLH